eukprot:6805878-Pyramimonas_sp.AAC.1
MPSSGRASPRGVWGCSDRPKCPPEARVVARKPFGDELKGVCIDTSRPLVADRGPFPYSAQERA